MILLGLRPKLSVELVSLVVMRDKKISGISTAAGIWATAGIGMEIGAGFAFLG